MYLRLLKVCAFCAVFSGSTVSARHMTILVYPFQNTGAEKYAWLTAGMTATVISDLGKVKDIDVISESDRRKAVKEIELAMTGLIDDEKAVRVGKVLGANVIFTGNYLVIGNKIRVNASLVDVEKGHVEKSVKLDGTVEYLFDLQDQIVLSLLAETEKIRIADIKPVKFATADLQRIQKDTRPSLNSYEWYAKGLEIRKSDPQGAMKNFRRAIELDSGYTDALRDAAMTAGNTLSLFDEAQGYLKKAEKIIARKEGKKSAAYAGLMNSIGVIYLNQGDLKKSIEYYNRAREIYDKLGLQTTGAYASLMNNIGIVYRNNGDLKHAIQSYSESKRIRDSLGMQKTAGYAELMNNAGIVYQEQGDLKGAIKGYMRSKQTYETIGLQKTDGYASVLNNIGIVHRMQGEYDKALEFHLKSKQAFDSLALQKTAGYGNVLYNIAIMYEKKKDIPQAREHFRQAYTTYLAIGRKKDAEDALRNAKRLNR